MTTATEEGVSQFPLRGARKMIADKMMRSLQTSAQLTHHARADMTDLLSAKAQLADDGCSLSVEDLVLAAVIRSLRRHPEMNGRVDGDTVHLSAGIDLSVAIALPGNLLAAPAIFSADQLALSDLAARRRDLVDRARAGRLTVPEMTGGTFTVSNLGLSRVEQFTPILNAPQIAILGIGRAVDTAVVRDGDLAFRPLAGLSLTFDHRAVDGAPAAAFLTSLCAEIEGFRP